MKPPSLSRLALLAGVVCAIGIGLGLGPVRRMLERDANSSRPDGMLRLPPPKPPADLASASAAPATPTGQVGRLREVLREAPTAAPWPKDTDGEPTLAVAPQDRPTIPEPVYALGLPTPGPLPDAATDLSAPRRRTAIEQDFASLRALRTSDPDAPINQEAFHSLAAKVRSRVADTDRDGGEP